MNRRSFTPSCNEIETLEDRSLMSGGLAGMYITGSARALFPIPVGTSDLPGWRQPNYWVGGQIIYGPGAGHQASGEMDFYGWIGGKAYYAGYLQVQGTAAQINFGGPVGNGLMNYVGYSGYVKGMSGTVNVSWAVGYGLSPDTFDFDGPPRWHAPDPGPINHVSVQPHASVAPAMLPSHTPVQPHTHVAPTLGSGHVGIRYH